MLMRGKLEISRHVIIFAYNEYEVNTRAYHSIARVIRHLYEYLQICTQNKILHSLGEYKNFLQAIVHANHFN